MKGSQLVTADRRLQDLGIQLPAAPTPFLTYVETVQTGIVSCTTAVSLDAAPSVSVDLNNQRHQ